MASLLPRWASSSSYHQLSKQEDSFIEKGPEEPREDEGRIIPSKRTSWWSSNTFLCITNILFASLSFYLYLTQRQRNSYTASLGSFEEGFTTEFSAVRGQISLENRMFYGAPRWSKDGVGSLLLDPNDRVFVGAATDELDDNWDDFIGGELHSESVLHDYRLIDLQIGISKSPKTKHAKRGAQAINNIKSTMTPAT
jgi:hypothetical protein